MSTGPGVRTMILLYDADCGFCTASAEWLERRRFPVAIRPMQSVDLAAMGVDPVRAVREIPLVAPGQPARYGSDAIGSALATGSWPWRLAGGLLRRRPGRWLARPIYAWVARNRHRLPGASAACRLPPD